jgi:hypothetical protein
MNKKRVLYFAIIIISVLIVTLLIIFLSIPSPCVDGTVSNSCSESKPYFCYHGKMTERASICKCPSYSRINEETCISDYQSGPKNITLTYTLNGKKGEIYFTVYKGMYDYLSKLPRYIDSSQNLTLADFKLMMINEEQQKELLFPLFLKITQITSNKEDQARIAISLIQNIPFGSSDKVTRIGSVSIAYQRYPYEVLYDMQGICSEKSELLLYLLREIGYGAASLYYNAENHEAVGIKCPSEKSVIDSGYCFVETTGPSIITDDQTDYFGTTRKLNSTPQVIEISEGNSLGSNLKEYNDAVSFADIREKMKTTGELNFFDSLKWNTLKKRYGLISFGHYEF